MLNTVSLVPVTACIPLPVYPLASKKMPSILLSESIFICINGVVAKINLCNHNKKKDLYDLQNVNVHFYVFGGAELFYVLIYCYESGEVYP